jgi:probable rRNA maturation factor
MPVRLEVTRHAGTKVPDGVDPVQVTDTAARATLSDRGVADAELSITLLDDADMASLNREWKERDGPTDVLAFTLHGSDEPPLGDIYIGLERAVRQAAELGEPVARELARLAIHGTLHVLGWDHPEEEREGSEMWCLQERILAEVRPE